MNLTKKQTIALDYLQDNITTEVLFGGAAGGGKSAFGVFWLILNCAAFPGTRWLMGRSSLNTLKKTTLNSFFEIAKREGLQVDKDFKFVDNPKNIIEFANGSTILLKDLAYYPSDPDFDSLGSLEITGAFIDECVQISERAKNIVKSRIRYKLDEYNISPKMLLTCNPSKNWVYREFYKPSIEKSLVKTKQFIQSLLTDNPYISKHYAENLKTLDETDKQRLLYGNWEYDDDEASLFKYNSILSMFAPKPQKELYKKFISADIARFGADKIVICVWYGWHLLEIIIKNKQSIDQTAKDIKEAAAKHGIENSNIIVDEDGVGGGVKDILKCKGFVNNSKPIMQNNYSNLKSQCYFEMSKKTDEIYISANISSEVKAYIIEEFEQVKRDKIDQDGKLCVIPKDQIKEAIGRSPDFSDAIMMREYFDLRPPQKTS